MHGVTLHAMHALLWTGCLLLLPAAGSAQTLAPKPSVVQRVTVATSATPRTGATGKVTLHLDVTPKPNIHVYATGAKEFTPVSLVITPRAGLTVGIPGYPTAHPAPPLSADTAPAYRAAFRIVQPITLAAATDDVVVSGVLNYQACDEHLCYPVASLPVSWTIKTR
jgi:hypothetical protein